MKALFWIGLVVLVLGVVSLLVPIPHNEREGIRAGALSLSVETRHDEKLSPVISALMIAGGIGMIIVGKVKS